MSGPSPGGHSERTRQQHPFLWAIVTLGTAVAAYLVLIAVIAVRIGPVVKDLGWLSEVRPDGTVAIVQVNPDGPAAGRLAPEDHILAIEGETPLERRRWRLWLLRPGDSYRIRISRGGVEEELVLPVRTRRDPRWVWRTLTINAPLALSCYVVGLLVGMLRPEKRSARLFALAGVLWAPGVMAASFPFDMLRGWALTTTLAARAWNPLVSAIAYHFYSEFPEGVSRGRGPKLLRVVFYLWAVVSCSWHLLVATFPGALSLRNQVWTRVDYWFELVTFAAIIAALVQSHRAAVSPDQRRRVRWVLLGSAVALVPRVAVYAFLLVSHAIGRHDLYMSSAASLMLRLADVLLLALPFTFLYAVAKHRLFDISLVLRRGIQYLLARNLLRAALLLPLVLWIGGVLAHPERTVREVLFAHPAYFMMAVASGWSLRFRRQLTAWVDRRFFRDAYAQEQILFALIQDVSRHNSLSELPTHVGQRLDEALHPDGVHLLLRAAGGRDFSCAYSSADGCEGLRAGDGPLVQRAQDASGVVELSSASEATMAEPFEARVLVPIRTSDGILVGMLLLGGKRSEEPYSGKDRTLLEALAAQIAIVYENDFLRNRVAQVERVQRDVLARLDPRGVDLLKECPACGLCYDNSVDHCERDGESLTFTLPISRTIAERYRLEKLLGTGGMGAVYEASDLRLDRKVAVKVLGAAAFGNLKALRRFESEARALARLKHPNIVAVHDFREIDPRGAYIVMDLLRGRSLRAEMQARGALPPVTVAEWFDQIFEGVKAAHGSGVIHRDLKPENVFVGQDAAGQSVLSVLDFGLAKLRDPESGDSSGLTAAGTVMGTRAYMSPEQLRGQHVDERTDIFSLGVLIVECLTGQNPFRERNAAEVTGSEVHCPIRIRSESSTVGDLNAALARCLAKDADARFPTVAAMQQVLTPLVRNCPRCWLAGYPGPDTEHVHRACL